MVVAAEAEAEAAKIVIGMTAARHTPDPDHGRP